jgi:hypothetical protein
LDYVTSWYVKSAEFITNSKIKVAFVSTNSICQGEQVGILWNLLFSNFKIKIHFAHRTFNWKNEAKGNAAVHCVIIGFASFDIIKKRIFEYKDIKGDPFEINVKNINPYLFEGKDLIITNRKSPICNVSEMNYGSMPIDDGNLIISDNEKESLLSSNPELNIAIRQYTGGDEFINKKKRWCLWLMDLEPSIIKNSKLIINRIDANKTFRLNSGRDATKKLAMTPMLFGENRQPNSDYILIPKVSTENRDYIPIGILPPSIIVNGSALVIKDANLLLFGILNSIMHMSWMKLTCGRMKSDFQYSASIVYNNFPWPEDPSEKQKKEVEDCGQIILDTRAEFPDSSLADLYNPLTMPKKLREAHNKLDRAVDKCYRSKPFASEEERVEFLFELYEKYTNTLTSQIKESPKKKKAK